MGLIIPLIIMLLFIVLIAYWKYDQYADVRKRFRGYKNITPEPFEMNKHNFYIYGPSNSGKTTCIKDFSSLYEPVHVFRFDEDEWSGYNINSVDDLKLLNLDNFDNSLIFDDNSRIAVQYVWAIL